MPASTDSKSPAAAGVKDEKPWCVVDPKELPFIPASPGDYTIVSKDTTWQGKPNPGGALTAFKIDKKALKKLSTYFKQRFKDETKHKRERHIEIHYSAQSVALALCALFEPEHEFLTNCEDWAPAAEALTLAWYWHFEEARTHLFKKLLDLVPNLDSSQPKGLFIIPYFSEAIRHGPEVFAFAIKCFESRHEVDPERKPLPIGHLHIYCHPFSELGPMGCSRLLDAIVKLVSDGVFKYAEE